MKVLLILLISISFSLCSYAQNLDEVFTYATELQKKQQYDEAIFTYQRLLYFDKQKVYGESSYKNIGLCYLAVKDFTNAANYFELAYFSAKSEHEKTELLFNKSLCLIQDKNFKYAEIELLNLPDQLSPEDQKRLSFYYGVLHYGNHNFKESEKSFIAAVDNKNYEDSIRFVFKKVYKANKINPKTAKLLSTILPGAGQIYNGDFKNGLNSLILLGGFGILAYNTAVKYSFIDAAISVLPWYQRYYMGGYGKAEEIALQRKEKKIKSLKNELLVLIAKSKNKL